MWDAAALFQHVSFIFSSSSPSPQIKHSQGAPEQPHPSSSHEAVPADGGHRLLPSLRSQSLLSCQQLREQHRTCAGRPLPFTSVQLSPFSGADTCCTACRMSQAMPSGEQPCPVPALCPQAMFLSHFWKMVHVKHTAASSSTRQLDLCSQKIQMNSNRAQSAHKVCARHGWERRAGFGTPFCPSPQVTCH